LSLEDSDYIEPLFDLRFTIKTAVEWSQYLSEIPYKVALNNTLGFLETYRELDKEGRKRITNDLFWLKEFDKTDEFYEKAEGIKDKMFKSEIDEIRTIIGPNN
jgi:hypothetical protein